MLFVLRNGRRGLREGRDESGCERNLAQENLRMRRSGFTRELRHRLWLAAGAALVVCLAAGAWRPARGQAPGVRVPTDAGAAARSGVPAGAKRSASIGIRSTLARCAVTIVTFAVIPGFSNSSGLSTLTTTS